MCGAPRGLSGHKSSVHCRFDAINGSTSVVYADHTTGGTFHVTRAAVTRPLQSQTTICGNTHPTLPRSLTTRCSQPRIHPNLNNPSMYVWSRANFSKHTMYPGPGCCQARACTVSTCVVSRDCDICSPRVTRVELRSHCRDCVARTMEFSLIFITPVR